MITVTQAKHIVKTCIQPLPPRRMKLSEAAGKVLAADVYAAADFPPFLQSSMDGYAFQFEDFVKGEPLKIDGEMAAGARASQLLKPGTAARIFTGAPLPEGADTVVMQEKSLIRDSSNDDRFLTIEDNELKRGMNTRARGAEIARGEKALQKGNLLTAAALGFLAGIGVSEVEVIPHPAISLIITGNELQQPGLPLQFGQVYESNSLALSAVLTQFHFDKVEILYAPDEVDSVTRALGSALERSDLVLLSGGISVGAYDFVLEATRRTGVSQLFHKVKQRPGKPLFFGKQDEKVVVFGLPGNPSSVLTCFYEYVLPALGVLTQKSLELQTLKAPLVNPFLKTARLTHFLKGVYEEGHVEVLGAQESFRLSSYARANCLVRVEEEMMDIPKGAEVEIHLLPRY